MLELPTFLKSCKKEVFSFPAKHLFSRLEWMDSSLPRRATSIPPNTMVE
jgi:hypothetical protein